MAEHEESSQIQPMSAILDGVAPPAPRGRLGLPSTFSALRHRNYRLYFFGQMVSLTGTWMQNVAQSWLVYQLTGSPLYLGIVSFSSSVPTLVLSLWAGVIIDRVHKRTRSEERR